MHMQKYKMAILMPSYDENSSEYPSKKVWFDASEWLATSQYIKVSDFFLINKKIIPIENVNSVDVLKSLKITRTLQEKINDSRDFPELHILKNMNSIDFLKLMQDKFNYEYVYTEFDEESLKPVRDFFLLKFPFKGKKYELLVIRSIYENEYTYDSYWFILRENEWHNNHRDIMTYRDYLEGKIDSYK
ncbi:hypothetical protein [Xenorhabdus bovienii]|uniref:Uncharacterized protein n=1 Tax=Xenorhabdus bovienii TaxID=40576 RepID=A0A0B6X600_XENBV|nr:hypothetical protein [Xenorhabdus bovienii]CDM88586.1 conserved protein of unknown function [Xenorhabdus bovienii]